MLDRYDAANALRSYSGPVAVLLAGKDTLVPTHFRQTLFDGYSGPKKLWIQPNADHTSLDYIPKAKWWREIENFLTS